MGKIPKDIKGHLFPTVAVHSQNEEYVLSFCKRVQCRSRSTYAMRFFRIFAGFLSILGSRSLFSMLR